MEPLDFETPVKSTKRDWREQDAATVNERLAKTLSAYPMEAVVFNDKGELTDPPDCTPRRMLKATDTSIREDIEIAQQVMADVNEMVHTAIKDNVVLPEHYARFAIEPIRFICENKLNFFQANIIKYIMRWDAKNGLEDLRKAQRYLTMFIRFVEGDKDWWKK